MWWKSANTRPQISFVMPQMPFSVRDHIIEATRTNLRRVVILVWHYLICLTFRISNFYGILILILVIFSVLRTRVRNRNVVLCVVFYRVRYYPGLVPVPTIRLYCRRIQYMLSIFQNSTLDLTNSAFHISNPGIPINIKDTVTPLLIIMRVVWWKECIFSHNNCKW